MERRASQTRITTGKFNLDDAATSVPESLRSALEFMKAGRRIVSERGVYGGAQPSATAWLLKFARTDLAALSVGGLSDWWEEVRRFSIDAGLSAEGLTNQTSVSIAIAEPPLKFLVRLQSEVIGILDEYVSGGKARFEKMKLTVTVNRQRSGVSIEADDVETGFRYQMAHLLGAQGARIRQCRSCQIRFLAGRTDKAFCSGLCQAKHYKREHPKETKSDRRPGRPRKDKPNTAALVQKKGGRRGKAS